MTNRATDKPGEAQQTGRVARRVQRHCSADQLIVWAGRGIRFYVCESLAEALETADKYGGKVYERLASDAARQVMQIDVLKGAIARIALDNTQDDTPSQYAMKVLGHPATSELWELVDVAENPGGHC